MIRRWRVQSMHTILACEMIWARVLIVQIWCVVVTASADVDATCSAGEKQQVAYPDKVLACPCLAAPATWRAEPLWEFLHPRNCGCNPLARLAVLPPREHRELAFPVGTSGGPGLVRVGSQ